jgi:hypothetical protein
MFRNPVYDLMVVVPALLITGLIAFFIMTTSVRAAELPAALASSTPVSISSSTLPDPSETVLLVTRAELTTAPQTASRNAKSVRTTSDLLVFAKQTLASDPYIAAIRLSNGDITVTYRRQGLVLGLVPIAVPKTATVHTDGSVTFVEPWYGSLTMEARDHMQTALEVRVHSLLTSEDYLPSMRLAPVTQAEILDIIRELVG